MRKFVFLTLLGICVGLCGCNKDEAELEQARQQLEKENQMSQAGGQSGQFQVQHDKN